LEISATSKSTWKSVISGTNSASVSSDEITEDFLFITEVFVETVEALEFKVYPHFVQKFGFALAKAILVPQL
jgi:hypothetical protein